MKYQYPLQAIHNNGYVILLHSIEDVVQFLQDYGRWEDKHIIIYDVGFTHRSIITNWIVRDDLGQIVNADDWINQFYPKRISYWERRCRKIAQAMELGLPIPGTGRRKYHKNYTGKGLGLKQRLIEKSRRNEKWD